MKRVQGEKYYRETFLSKGEELLEEFFTDPEKLITKILGTLSVRRVAPGAFSYKFNSIYDSKETYYNDLRERLITNAFESKERSRILQDAIREISSPQESPPTLSSYLDYCSGRLAREDSQLIPRYLLRPHISHDDIREGLFAGVAMHALMIVDSERVSNTSSEQYQDMAREILAAMDAAAVIKRQEVPDSGIQF